MVYRLGHFVNGWMINERLLVLFFFWLPVLGAILASAYDTPFALVYL